MVPSGSRVVMVKASLSVSGPPTLSYHLLEDRSDLLHLLDSNNGECGVHVHLLVQVHVYSFVHRPHRYSVRELQIVQKHFAIGKIENNPKQQLNSCWGSTQWCVQCEGLKGLQCITISTSLATCTSQLYSIRNLHLQCWLLLVRNVCTCIHV